MGSELAYAIHDCRPRILIADAERIERLQKELQGLDVAGVVAVRTADDLAPSAISWDDEAAALDPEATLPDVLIVPEDDATILYTSGTTGAPKGTVASHRNHVTNLRNGELRLRSRPRRWVSLWHRPPCSPRDCRRFHCSTSRASTRCTSRSAAGAKLALMHRGDSSIAAGLDSRRAHHAVSMVPTIVRQLLDHADDTASVGRADPSVDGWCTRSPELIRRLGTRFNGRVVPGNGYGLTETTSAVVTNSGDDYLAHPESIGRPVPGADVRIVDPDSGADVDVSKVGELWFRGPNIVRGYWNRPDDTAAAFTDGWFHSGDLGNADDAGLLHVVDRMKDVIIRSGETCTAPKWRRSCSSTPRSLTWRSSVSCMTNG